MTDRDIKRRIKYGVWEALPITEKLRDVSREKNHASIYALEKAIAEATEHTQDEVRALLQQAIHDGYIVRKGEWVTLAPQYRYEEIDDWDE